MKLWLERDCHVPSFGWIDWDVRTDARVGGEGHTCTRAGSCLQFTAVMAECVQR